MSVVRLLKKTKLHPYKIHLVHELNEDNPDCRLQFWEDIEALNLANPLFIQKIVFSDNCRFLSMGL